MIFDNFVENLLRRYITILIFKELCYIIWLVIIVLASLTINVTQFCCGDNYGTA
uniref:Uncharacterized protein n=1 Tax=uncultured bacterium contig00049 TaxID=1181534 RepID=A0A806KH98_9BACT|nr:hypothetical protein [uncultured bacterium contig00049]